jgi:excinuclease ABC subunit A
VIVIEHDEETMRSADHIIDVGPGAGERGGDIVAQGSLKQICDSKHSLTGAYLRHDKIIAIPEKRRKLTGEYITIVGAKENNLKNIKVKFPVSQFIAVTGVSGSGKSTLVNEVLYKGLAREVSQGWQKPGRYDRIEGKENIDKIIDIDQSPIGRTPRSNPATYTKSFDLIRELFTATPESRLRGYDPGRFSFNVSGGRCEKCKGDGTLKIEMHFLPDVYISCDVCQGRRYNRETLQVRYKNKNISEVLDMTVDEASEFFAKIPKLSRKLQVLQDVGLGYIKLGQSATTLSGGEAQRIKLSAELSKRSTGKTLYVLDEPTTGLHFDDVKKLLTVLDRLVDQGNTVVVIEHNLDVIKVADYIIDLGPEGGDNGGRVVTAGTPEAVAGIKDSCTGNFLKRVLKDG